MDIDTEGVIRPGRRLKRLVNNEGRRGGKTLAQIGHGAGVASATIERGAPAGKSVER